ncbi:hippurate hydrolase [Azospirillum lipoferum]|uniref:Amidohydrolase n=1 Tax=Azospirillum lipoferum TaxID=193 RepID=A0A5A9GTE7_AZOLI|nr:MULTISPECIES: M20 aminoacylase family protein [Azospirillum]KAA0597721.1 amidohydrolase [Azospirillum lipoferum]MCP1610146.1 hippurate hydrolase [Azospirillum lipoferum]MDW5534361.1 M20 aminoacylase family protein [Azospirillum sp. NL1]
MPINNRIAAFQDDMTVWRRDIHAHPELGFEEKRTSDIVAAKLAEFGITVHRGLGGTGVVGTLTGLGTGSGRAIGLRADMDALPMPEANDFDHASRHAGKMHACGHDGHTTMLLGAARYLAETRNFDGTVHFIFQPAEEGLGGAKRMIDDGLFRQFDCEQVYGLHNWPELPAGQIAVHPGPVMAAANQFEIHVTGHGAHAAMPHRGIDPVLVSAHIITAAQSLVSRGTNPAESAVVSITVVEAGTAANVIPDSARMLGTMRTFSEENHRRIQEQFGRLVSSIAEGLGAKAELRFRPGYPATINSEPEARIAASAAARVVGEENVVWAPPPTMAAEDFGYMLKERPGAYIWLGHGGHRGPSCRLHNPHYDFNDAILTTGASYWASLVETILPRSA